jgi:hypothetical protein
MIYAQYLSNNGYQDFVSEYNYFLDNENGNNETDYQSTETFFSDADTMPKAA